MASHAGRRHTHAALYSVYTRPRPLPGATVQTTPILTTYAPHPAHRVNPNPEACWLVPVGLTRATPSPWVRVGARADPSVKEDTCE